MQREYAPERTREELRALMNGDLGTAEGRSDLVRLALRLFVEERRRLKIIPNGFGEKPVLKLMFGALIRAADRWRGLRFTEFELRASPPSERNSIRNTRLRSRRWQGHPSPEFPANPCLDHLGRALPKGGR